MKALLEISFKPYAMTVDKLQGRQDQEKIVKDDFRTQFQHDRDRICDKQTSIKDDNIKVKVVGGRE